MQQLHGALAMEKKVFIHHEESLDFQAGFHPAHDLEKFVAGLEEVDELSLASEEGRGGAEVAAYGTADRGNDGGGCTTLAIGQAQAQDAGLNDGDDFGMMDRRLRVFAEIFTH